MNKWFHQLVAGNYNAKQVKTLEKKLPLIHQKEKKLGTLSDTELQKQFATWKEELTAEPNKVDQYLIDVFAGIREASKRLVGKEFEVRGKKEPWNMVHYDVQLIGGMVLHEGKIAEMKTGEGKTLVSTLPVILNALTSKGVHVVTVNDYLAQRDSEWMTPLYAFCGLSVGVIISGITTEERKEAYKCDITYGTNNEFGFDYLRENMAQDPEAIVQGELHYAIIDEVDSILIDEARTPLIISSPADESTDKYLEYSRIIPKLKENTDYNIDLKHKSATLTEAGVKKLEDIIGIHNLFEEKGFEEVHHIEQALKAEVIFEKDKDYVVQEGQVIIIDEFTGRMMPGRRFSDGLHQALEAKESVEIQRESKTLATITFQNYFRLYDKLAGMTGTAETEAEEFAKIYSLDVTVIPPNKPIQRQDLKDKIFKNERGKFTALIKAVKELHEKGQPVLIGTVNIDKSELISQFLKQQGIKHEVLNAKHHEREAEIVSQAGQKGAVTVATNMAGRGTDIKINDEVKALGGFVILGTERHESRRIDNQLRGRAGRQGDPGMSQFYISMEDDLMRRFGGEKMKVIMDRLGIADDEAIEQGMITRSVENAQKKIEGHHFDARKHVLQYDDVMNIHREKIYAKRRFLLKNEDIMGEVEDMMKSFVSNMIKDHCPTPDHASSWNIQEVFEVMESLHKDESNPLSFEELDAFQHRDELIESLQNYVLTAWDEKQDQFPEEEVDKVTRYVVLRSIDELWLEHIDAMTQLRDKVALSGYAQRDPVMEYKREAFEMFQRLLYSANMNSIQNLFRVSFAKAQEIAPRQFRNAQTNQGDIEANLNDTSELGVGPTNNTGNLPGLGGQPMSRQQRRAMERKK